MLRPHGSLIHMSADHNLSTVWYLLPGCVRDCILRHECAIEKREMTCPRMLRVGLAIADYREVSSTTESNWRYHASEHDIFQRSP